MNQLKSTLRQALVCASMLALSAATAAHAASPAYLDIKLSPEARAKDIVSRLTLEEKAAQMQDNAPAIPRLDIPVATNGVQGPFGTWFSFDGAHPAREGHRAIADALITAINAKYGTTIPACTTLSGGRAPTC